MIVPGTEVPETATPIGHTQTQPKRTTAPDRTADKRAAATRANMKKKRAAHRVALRRSHTGG
jgi:hypothetical protein